MSDIPFLNRCSDERDSNIISSLSAGLRTSTDVPVTELTFSSMRGGEDPQTPAGQIRDPQLEQDLVYLGVREEQR